MFELSKTSKPGLAALCAVKPCPRSICKEGSAFPAPSRAGGDTKLTNLLKELIRMGMNIGSPSIRAKSTQLGPQPLESLWRPCAGILGYAWRAASGDGWTDNLKPDIDCDRDMVPVTKFEIILHLGLMAVREPRKRYPTKSMR